MEAFLPNGKTPRCQETVKSGLQCNNGAQKGFNVCGPHNKGQAPATPAVEEVACPRGNDHFAVECSYGPCEPKEASPVETMPKGWLSYKLTCKACGRVFELNFTSVEKAMSTQAAFKAANGICKGCRK